MTHTHMLGLLAAVSLSAAACAAAESSPPPAMAAAAPASTSKPLTITSPVANARVSGSIVEVAGAGADPRGQIEVSVLTDAWYPQNGTATINADGSFSYAPVYVSGVGRFNNHTIRVTVLRDGRRLASASVVGVVRLD